MKIAMIGHKRIPSREGGVEIVVEELSTRMVKQNHKVDVYNRKNEESTLKEYKGVNIKNISTIDIKGSDAIVYSILATLRAIVKRYDVIHYHAEGPCAMLWLPKLLGIKTVATIHGLDWQRSKWGGLATRYIKFGEKMAAKHADEVIVLSENIKQYFKDEYNREVVYIPNAVNKPQIKEANVIQKQFNLKKDEYLLYLARIVPEKGVHYLIDAYKNLDTNKKLVIAGDLSANTEYMLQIKELAKKDSRIILAGFVQGEILEELFSNAYVYILPSDVEGMPISLMEAMSYGNCCLSSNIDENTQIAKGNSFYFEKSNVKSLQNMLEYLICNEDIVKENGEISRKYILENYSWDSVVEETIKLYGNYNLDSIAQERINL